MGEVYSLSPINGYIDLGFILEKHACKSKKVIIYNNDN